MSAAFCYSRSFDRKGNHFPAKIAHFGGTKVLKERVF